VSVYKKIFQQTAIYGLAAVVPRVIGFLLVPFHTSFMSNSSYGQYSVVFSIMMFMNVILTFGMETAFFRFYNKRDDKKEVINNATLFLLFTSLAFLFVAGGSGNFWSNFLNIPNSIINYVIGILVLDALVAIPFAQLRADQRPIMYSAIRIGNVLINTFFTFFFLFALPLFHEHYPGGFFDYFYINNFQVEYLFIANLIASLATFLIFIPHYFRIKWKFNLDLGKQMMQYGVPIMIGGLAFAINEGFDKILLERLLPSDIALSEVGKYSACYKLGLFMVLFRQAYTLGIEPFFFNYAKHDDAPTKYATITKYFVLCGSFIMLGVIVFADFLKVLFVRNESYWEAMSIVPLIILANFCMGIYTNLSVWYKLKDKTMMGAYISILGAVLTLVFNYLLIPIMGYMGSAIATLIAYGSMMFISYVLGQKYYPIPYDKKAIGLFMGLSTLFSYIYFYHFRENYLVGLGLIALFFGFIVYQEKHMVKRFLKK